MDTTTILTLIHQALQEDTYNPTLKGQDPPTLAVHVPSTGKTHSIHYNQTTQEITITEGITYLDPDNNFHPYPGQGTTIHIANPNLFHQIHTHLNNKPAIPLPASTPPPTKERDLGQEADSYKHHPPRGNA